VADLRILNVDTSYPEVVRATQAATPGWHDLDWRGRRDAVLASEFGMWDSVSAALTARGATAEEFLLGLGDDDEIRAGDYDAIIVNNVGAKPREFWAKLANETTLCAHFSHQHPSPTTLSAFRLSWSAFPHYVQDGIADRYLPLAFDPRRIGLAVDGSGAVEDVPEHGSFKQWEDRDIPVSFVGGLGVDRHWQTSQHAISTIAEQVSAFRWWGYRGADPLTSALRDTYVGEAWGRGYFDILGRTRLSLNRHGEVHTSPRVGEPGRNWWACNMRLFEATGMGSCLFTEASNNLGDLFEPYVEVVPYTNPRDLLLKIDHYLCHPEDAQRIASRGQHRTLQKHKYWDRAETILNWLEDVA
jgi:hypothetical protein